MAEILVAHRTTTARASRGLAAGHRRTRRATRHRRTRRAARHRRAGRATRHRRTRRASLTRRRRRRGATTASRLRLTAQQLIKKVSRTLCHDCSSSGKDTQLRHDATTAMTRAEPSPMQVSARKGTSPTSHPPTRRRLTNAPHTQVCSTRQIIARHQTHQLRFPVRRRDADRPDTPAGRRLFRTLPYYNQAHPKCHIRPPQSACLLTAARRPGRVAGLP